MKRWYRFRGLLLLVVAEMERTDTHTHTHTHESSTVTLVAHARRGLIALHNMNQLQNFGVNPGLPRSEFVNILKLRTSDVLRSLRASLFTEACAKNLVSQELQGLPLVNRRDTALRPATKILGEDIWHIINSISNNVIVPRVLFRNGKKSKSFLENAPVLSKILRFHLLKTSPL